MRRLNPWVVGSIGIGFAAGAFIGWIVTRVGCAEGSCIASAIFIGFISGLVAAAGVGVVVVLADRSIREWRAAEHAGGPMPEVGCETGEDAD